MHEYSNVEILSLDEPTTKTSKTKTGSLKLDKAAQDKVYSLVLNGSDNLTIKLDESIEYLRSGSTGIVISLPKQENSSHLFKFADATGNERRNDRAQTNVSFRFRRDQISQNSRGN